LLVQLLLVHHKTSLLKLRAFESTTHMRQPHFSVEIASTHNLEQGYTGRHTQAGNALDDIAVVTPQLGADRRLGLAELTPRSQQGVMQTQPSTSKDG
jgi:hypothetical protein